jgi:hypothetical protein
MTGTAANESNTVWCSGKSSRPCMVVMKGVGWREKTENGK